MCLTVIPLVRLSRRSFANISQCNDTFPSLTADIQW